MYRSSNKFEKLFCEELRDINCSSTLPALFFFTESVAARSLVEYGFKRCVNSYHALDAIVIASEREGVSRITDMWVGNFKYDLFGFIYKGGLFEDAVRGLEEKGYVIIGPLNERNIHIYQKEFGECGAIRIRLHVDNNKITQFQIQHIGGWEE